LIVRRPDGLEETIDASAANVDRAAALSPARIASKSRSTTSMTAPDS
jgi:hypothetical protein